jgi:hypothetical protein
MKICYNGWILNDMFFKIANYSNINRYMQYSRFFLYIKVFLLGFFYWNKGINVLNLNLK